MNDAAIRQILLDRNPWWRDERWEDLDPDLRDAIDAPFSYEPEPLADIHPPGLYVLRGPRRVGKSLELKRAISRLIRQGVGARSIVFCSCDGFTAQDLRRLFVVAASLPRPNSTPRYWFLDEISAVTGDWPGIVKDVRDQTDARNDCVVLTGSSARGLQSATKALAGRRGEVTRPDRLLLPMTFRAYCSMSGRPFPDAPRVDPADLKRPGTLVHLDELQFFANGLQLAWEQYLTVGGFPRAVSQSTREGDVSEGFVGALWDVVRGDAILQTGASEPEAVALMERLARNLASPVNLSSIAGDIGVATSDSVRQRVDNLVASFLAWRCHQERDDVPHRRAQDKVYFTDPLVARLVSVRDPRRQAPDMSQLSEQQLGLALARAVEERYPGRWLDASAVMYRRNKKGTEIDFVGSLIGDAFESKYVDRNWKGEARAIAARPGGGIVGTRSVLDTDGDVWAIPASMLVYLMGT